MLDFEKSKIFRNTTNSFYSGQLSLRIIAELLKNAPVLRKRFRKPRLWWEQWAILPTVLDFLLALSRIKCNADLFAFVYQISCLFKCYNLNFTTCRNEAEDTVYSPEELTAMVLNHSRSLAEEYARRYL